MSQGIRKEQGIIPVLLTVLQNYTDLLQVPECGARAIVARLSPKNK